MTRKEEQMEMALATTIYCLVSSGMMLSNKLAIRDFPLESWICLDVYTQAACIYIYILYMHARTCMSARMVMVHACMHANRHTDIHRQTGRDRLRQSMCVCVHFVGDFHGSVA